MRVDLPGSGRGWMARPWRRLLRATADRVTWLDRIRNERRLRRQMQDALGYAPDLRHPRTFNERIARKILDDRNPLIPLTLDKVAVRDWVAGRIGEAFLVPLFGVWERARDIPWDDLPSRFVAKTNHGCAYNILVSDKASQDREAVIRQLDAWMAENYYDCAREWGYRSIPRRILVEEFLRGRQGGVPEDYKLFVFGGQPRLLKVIHGRFTPEERHFYYDPQTFQPLDIGCFRPADYPGDAGPPPEARQLHDLAARLGAPFDAVRVDFYLIDGRPLFGELTHYTGAASLSLGSYEKDLEVGEMWAEALRLKGKAGAARRRWPGRAGQPAPG
ncbi:ATP-grasp fold amidoligase family protein [Belnapia rosea]|uniref:TupA-like ATPgrasp n=1 Tax=Belnapia rosea TaxID=938405 RepID=A0A1G6IYF7_9PROT|nr:ATP-grasp fold amidoligase family protein [Belnapia rosea]SDC11534.1 TupA-like ATPgrasp [Belnapia rosea]